MPHWQPHRNRWVPMWRVVSLTVQAPAMLLSGELSPEEARPISVVGMSQIIGSQAESASTTGDWFGLLFLPALSVSLSDSPICCHCPHWTADASCLSCWKPCAQAHRTGTGRFRTHGGHVAAAGLDGLADCSGRDQSHYSVLTGCRKSSAESRPF